MDLETEVVVDQNPITNPSTADTPAPVESQEATPETPEAKPEPKEEPIPKGVQKRIDRAVRQKYEAEARTKALEEQLERLQRAAPQQHRQPEQGTPTIDKFDNLDDYVAAKAEWIADKKIKETLTEQQQRQAEEREAAERKKTVDSWSKRLAQATASEEMPDFEDALASSDVPMTPVMQHGIMTSEIGTKLAYYLAKNPEEAEKISMMAPDGVMRALGRLEERLATQKKTSVPTSAPEPIKAISTRTVVTKDPGKMSDAEYAKWRAQGRKRA
jgi:hypothetical protein